MKYLFLSAFFMSSSVYASPISSIEKSLGYGTFNGQIESGEKCSIEINKVNSQMIRIFFFNPRVSRLEITNEDHLEYIDGGVRISKPVMEENGAKITNTFVVSGRMVGIEREFCTYKCWTSMTPCILDY